MHVTIYYCYDIKMKPDTFFAVLFLYVSMIAYTKITNILYNIPKSHVSYCHHFASVIVVVCKYFSVQFSSITCPI